MYFPDDVIVEMAFANDINEADYGQSGYTEVTQYVRSISGTLRGRQYELGRAEAGTLSVTLDNGDRRFSPGTAVSPYFPNVKPGRRFRVRGRNMVHPNVGRTGSRDRDFTGFLLSEIETTNSLVEITTETLPQQTFDSADQPQDLTHYISASVVNPPQGTTVIAQWYAPMEYGVRLVHSAYAWKISGPSAVGDAKLAIQLQYFDKNDEEVGEKDPVTLVIDPTIRPVSAALGTPVPTSPSRVQVGHAPLGTAKYVLASLVYTTTFTPTAGTYVFGVGAIQAEVPGNLAPDVSGWYDVNQWQIEGDGTYSQTTNANPALNAVKLTWADDDAFGFITIPHLVPGDTYTVAVQGRVISGPNVQVSTDDGQTYTTITGSSFATYTYSFVAAKSEQPLQFFPATATSAGNQVEFRLLNVQAGGSASIATSSVVDSTVGGWQRPYDIYEGWTEDFPLRADEPNTVTVTVVDRMKRMGQVILSAPYAELLTVINPEFWLPLEDDTSTNEGKFELRGSWGGGETGYLEIASTKSGPGSGTYDSTGNTNMIGNDGLFLTPVSDRGYFFPIPYEVVDLTPTTPPSTTTPPPPTTTKRRYVYTKTFYATWSRSYDGNGDTRYNDPPTMYHGYYDSFNGNQRSLIGFNYGAIQAALKGATILSTKLTLKGEHAGLNSGIASLKVGTHTNASKPGSFANSTLRWTFSIGETQQKTFSLGVSAGNWFKAGSIKGISLGPASSTSSANYGYLRGATQSGKPYLTIQYEIWK